MIQDWPKEAQIEEISFSGLTVDICTDHFTGTLRVEKGTTIKVLYFKSGSIAYASSNETSDKLGSVLIKAGKISEEQYESANSKISGGKTLGKVLIEMGILSPNELLWSAKKQVEQIFTSIFDWKDGRYELLADSLPEGLIDLKIKTEGLIYQGIKEIQDQEKVLSEIGGLNAVYNFTDNFMESYEKLHVDEHVDAVIANIDGTRSVARLSEIGTESEFEVAKIVYFCKLFNLVKMTSTTPSEPAKELLTAESNSVDSPFFAESSAPGNEGESLSVTGNSEPEGNISNNMDFSLFNDESQKENSDFINELIIPKDERNEMGPVDNRAKGPLFKIIVIVVVILAIGALGTVGWHSYNYWLSQQKIVDDFPTMTDDFFTDKHTVKNASDSTVNLEHAGVQDLDKTASTKEEVKKDEEKPALPVKDETESKPAPAEVKVPATQTETTTVVAGESTFSECREKLKKGDYNGAAKKGLAAIKSEDSSKYTIQLELVCQKQSIAKAFEFAPKGSKFFVVPTNFHGRNCFKICWGIYSTESEAKQAISELPDYFLTQDYKPQITQLTSLQ